MIASLAVKFVDYFIGWYSKGILENGQALPKQLACEHAKDITFLSGESWENCLELSYSLFCTDVFPGGTP